MIHVIVDLLFEYYTAFGTNPTYTILRSIVVDGHEIAWMRFEGIVDIPLFGKEGKPYVGNMLFCECDFKKDVGWQIHKGNPCTIGSRGECLPRQAAIHLRQLELRSEYLRRFEKTTDSDALFLPQQTPKIVCDLIEKVKAGEFIGEDGSGAEFWGGYFYLQTLASILDLPMSEIWKEADPLIEQKKISLEGAVVQKYRRPPPPRWEECFRIEENGFVGIASLPTHSKMPQCWKFERCEVGKKKRSLLGHLPLAYFPDFGPDVDDVEEATQELKKLMSNITSEKPTKN
ncbi:MAG: hypothetical protein HZA36_01520 [Parcubacteria group bacterium]|nr:hypothetical protein [Parcubacteria group bacterium]